MNDPAAQYFTGAVRQFEPQLGPETTSYLLQTYQIGEREAAFTNLVTCLTELGYNEATLMQGQLGQLAQMLGVDSSGVPQASAAAVPQAGSGQSYASDGPQPAYPGVAAIEGQIARPPGQALYDLSQVSVYGRTQEPAQEQPQTANQTPAANVQIQQPTTFQPTQVAPTQGDNSNDEGTLQIHR